MVDAVAGAGKVIRSSSSVVDESPNVGLRSKPPKGRLSSRVVFVDVIVWFGQPTFASNTGKCVLRGVSMSSGESGDGGLEDPSMLIPFTSPGCTVFTCSTFAARRSFPSSRNFVPRRAVFRNEPLRFRVFFCWTADAIAPPGDLGLMGGFSPKVVFDGDTPTSSSTGFGVKKDNFDSMLPDRLLLCPLVAVPF